MNKINEIKELVKNSKNMNEFVDKSIDQELFLSRSMARRFYTQSINEKQRRLYKIPSFKLKYEALE